MGSIIEYSLDGGVTWFHGRTVEAWVAADKHVLAGQRGVVRGFAIEEHGSVERIVTRVLSEDDPRAVVNRVLT